VRFLDSSVLQEKRASETPRVALHAPDAVAAEERLEPAPQHAGVQERADAAAPELERGVQLAFGIGDEDWVWEVVAREKGARLLVVVRGVDQAEARPARLELRFPPGQFGQRLAAERSPEVAEEDDEDGVLA